MKKIFKTFGLLLAFIVVCFLTGCTGTTQKVIVSIEKTSTKGNIDIYTITYSDNTTTTMEVNNGQKTIIEIKKTSSVGKMDIYTITYSDNTTETFTITNGEDGKDAKPITINDLYESWKESLSEGEDDSFNTFLKNYITIEDSSNLYNVSKSITSVVTINTVFNYKQSSFFGNVSETQKMSAGSGVIIDMSEEDKNNGSCYIITNYHVVYDSTSVDKNGISEDIRVYLYGMDGVTPNIIKAEYVGGSMNYDIAVLKVTGSEILKNSIATQ